MFDDSWRPRRLHKSADDTAPLGAPNESRNAQKCKFRDIGENLAKRGRYAVHIHISYEKKNGRRARNNTPGEFQGDDTDGTSVNEDNDKRIRNKDASVETGDGNRPCGLYKY